MKIIQSRNKREGLYGGRVQRTVYTRTGSRKSRHYWRSHKLDKFRTSQKDRRVGYVTEIPSGSIFFDFSGMSQREVQELRKQLMGFQLPPRVSYSPP